MPLASRTHWIGVFLLFASSILLLITTISAPIWNNVGLLKVHLNNGTQAHRNSTISFGTFGYCILNAGPQEDSPDWCTGRHIGYAPAHVIAASDHTQLTDIEAGTSDSLTRAMVLHPIACGVAFIAWLVSLGAGVIGSLFGVLTALVAWLLCLIVLATDFSLFGILRHHVNDSSSDRSGSRAYFGAAIWCLPAAFVLLFFAMVVVTFTCFSARRERKRGEAARKEAAAAAASAAAPRRKKRFGLF